MVLRVANTFGKCFENFSREFSTWTPPDFLIKNSCINFTFFPEALLKGPAEVCADVSSRNSLEICSGIYLGIVGMFLGISTGIHILQAFIQRF